jgi:D-glycero-D-manno-heptose 1,7-bisphosphate phosphatase
MNRAVFLDRDGTILEEVDRLTDPRDVALIPGAAQAIRDLRAAGYLCIVVTNQSAIGLGLLDEPGLAAVHREMNERLAQHGTALDAIFFSPDAPNAERDAVAGEQDRKPGSGMLLRAARLHDIDLERSWMVGDSLRDLVAGRSAGCRAGVLVRTGHGRRFESGMEPGNPVCDDLRAAAQWILAHDRPG